jgi:hypothetical protein
MADNQIHLLNLLAKKIAREQKHKDKKSIIESFRAAKILTSKGNFTSHYQNLKKAVELSNV